MALMTLTIERVRAFNGLDVLVAKDEGLFAAEGTVYAGLQMLQGAFDVTTQINRRIERDAHARAGLEEGAR